MTRRTAVAGLALLLGAGCQDPTGPAALPGGLVLPEPSSSLDPDSVVVGDLIASSCHVYLPERIASGAAAFVDIYFFDGELRPAPTSRAVRWVEAHDGVVVHRFNVHGVRAAVYLDRVAGLVDMDGMLVEVREVPAPARYDVPLITRYDDLIDESDPARYRQLGGSIRWYAGTHLVGDMPDRSIPALRKEPGLMYLLPEGVVCPED